MVLVFSLMFTTYVSFADKSARDTFSTASFNELTSLGVSITESFVSNTGVPRDWETAPANSQLIGFASTQNVLETAKLDAFVGMDYNTSKEKIGIAPFRSYHFTVTNSSNAMLYESGVVVNQSDSAFPFVRYAILNGSTVTLRLVLYE